MLIGNLPDPLSSFVGRVDEVKELVDDSTGRRVITLTGFGWDGEDQGLAIQVSQESTDPVRDGRRFVDLGGNQHEQGCGGAAAAQNRGADRHPTSSLMVSLVVDHLLLRDVRSSSSTGAEHVVGAGLRRW